MIRPKPNEYNSGSMALHPYRIFVVLILAGITMLFLGLSVSYMATRISHQTPPIRLPWMFIFNSIFLIGSSLTLWWAKRCYLNDDTKNYQIALGVTLLLSVIFLILQLYAWSQLNASGSLLTGATTSAYVHLISYVHFVHVIAGLPYLILFLYTARRRMKEPVSVLIYFSDPEKRLKLDLLTLYWHYLDILWIYLVVFFTVNYWIGVI